MNNTLYGRGSAATLRQLMYRWIAPQVVEGKDERH